MFGSEHARAEKLHQKSIITRISNDDQLTGATKKKRFFVFQHKIERVRLNFSMMEE